MTKKTVSIVIPAYNEEERLPLTLAKLAEYFSAPNLNFSLLEVIVIDDGSKDATAEKARSFSGKLPMVVLVTPRNRGKGHAVRTGMLDAKGDYIFMYDADAATPIEELSRLMEKTNEADVVIGSRVGENADVVMTKFRRFVGWCFHTLCAGLLPGIGDASCGAKLWSREAAQKVFKEVRLDRFAFDIESLWLAIKSGFKIIEVHVNWTAVPGSKVSIYRDSPEMFWSVVGLYVRKFKNTIFKKHWIALVLALVVGFIYIAPHVYFAQAPEYKGIYMSGTYDEDYYNGIIHQVYDGERVTQNAYNSEYKDKSISTMYNIPQAIMGWVGKILGLNISNLAIASKFFLPIAIFLLVYFFAFSLTKNKIAALIAACAMLLTQEVAPLNPSSFIKTLLFDSPFHNFLLFSRPVNPQFNALIFFGAIWSLARLWLNPYSKKAAVITGIMVGISGYFYFFYWNFLVITSGVMLIATFFRRPAFAKNMLLAIGVSLLVALPFLMSMFGVLFSGAASVGKNYVLTHRFIPEKIIILPLIILGVMYLWNLWKKQLQTFDYKYQFLFILLIGGFIASNQQVIHGLEVQQHHYHFMTNIPVFILTMSVLCGVLISRFKWKIAATSLVLAIIFLQAESIQASSYRYWEPIVSHNQSYATIFDWLQKNSSQNSVVYSNEQISQLIPGYTHNDVYSALHMSVYPIPLERLEHNYFVYLYLEGVKEPDVKDYLYKEENRNRIGQHLFEGQYWRAKCGSFGCFPDPTLDKLISKYKLFLKTPFETNLKMYRVDYVLWDRVKNPAWNLEKHAFLEKILTESSATLYRVK